MTSFEEVMIALQLEPIINIKREEMLYASQRLENCRRCNFKASSIYELEQRVLNLHDEVWELQCMCKMV